MTDDPCPFCEIIAKRAKGIIAFNWPDAIALVPLNPVNLHHLLFVPKAHFSRPDEDPGAYGELSKKAAAFAAVMGGDYNLIVNAGPDATQTVPHLHIHLVPRTAGDGLALPWTGQHRTERTTP